MDTIKISELEEITTLSTSDTLPIVNGNETKKVSVDKLDNRYASKNDLTKYSTTEQMNTALATKQPLLTAGDNITINENNVISASGGGSLTCDRVYSFDDTDLATTEVYNAFSEMINKYINSGYKTNSIVIINQNGTSGSAQENPPILFYRFHKISDTVYGIEGISFTGEYYIRKLLPDLKYELMYITITDGANGKEVTKIQRQSGQSYKILTANNTIAYAPADNYHPATKKYVDDSIKNAITTVLEAEY